MRFIIAFPARFLRRGCFIPSLATSPFSVIMKSMKPLLAQVDAALFDLDGTLVETNIDFALMKREMIALAREQGLDPDAMAELDILAIVEAAREVASRGGEDESEGFYARAMAVLQEIELRHAAETTQIPFARELAWTLSRRGIKLGVVTRNCRMASRLSLEIAGIAPDALICREDSRRHKPFPEPLRIALEALGARASASTMAGDHIMDIESGKAAGLTTIGLLREHRPRDFFAAARPDFVANNLEEVLRAIVDCDS